MSKWPVGCALLAASLVSFPCWSQMPLSDADHGPPGPGGQMGPGGPGGPGGPSGPGGRPSAVNTHGVRQSWLDVAYATLSPAEKLDIYLPDEGKGPFPVILAVHGGGFDGGDKRTGEVNAEMTGVTRGYAVVAVNYRLSGEAIFPGAVKDLKAAVRFLRANARRYTLNPNKIVAWGDSAGANLASLLGTSVGAKDLEDLGMGNADQSSKVQAVVDFFGPTNFNSMDEEYAGTGIKPFMAHSGATSSESRYMGAQISSVPEKVKQADPTTYITSSTVPFFIENGSNDPIVPPQQHVEFAAALEKAIGSNKVTHIVLEGAGHGGPPFEAPENLEKVFAFLEQHLK